MFISMSFLGKLNDECHIQKLWSLNTFLTMVGFPFALYITLAMQQDRDAPNVHTVKTPYLTLNPGNLNVHQIY
jgi:hypothetical protein